VCILRLKTGVNFSDLKVNHEQISRTIPSVKYEFKTTEKFSREYLNTCGRRCCQRLSEFFILTVDGAGNVEAGNAKKSAYANAGQTKNGQLSTVPELNDSCEDIDTNEIYKYGIIRSGRKLKHEWRSDTRPSMITALLLPFIYVNCPYRIIFFYLFKGTKTEWNYRVT
jgi:hypothetical protein